jgi:protein involved in polysaccharide export with SLBB domain
MEGAVDPDSYVVGPGDLFKVTIGGPEPLSVSIPVTADGVLVLPEAGDIEAAGRTLTQVRDESLAILETRYRNVFLSVTLVQPRQFYVHVTGAVPVPGRYRAAPVARVSSVLEIALKDTSQAAPTNPELLPSLRNVVLTRRSGERLSLDLRRYLVTGDTSENPYLQDGDVISVPAYDPDFESVFVDGSVSFPGAYDIRDGDDILDVLTLTAGETGLKNLRQVRLTRNDSTFAPRHTLVDVQAVLQGTVPPPALQPLDHIFVIPRQREGGSVSVQGYVEYPGTYPIVAGRTTLRNVIEDQAGGLRPEALARGAYLERATVSSSFGGSKRSRATSLLAQAYAGSYTLPADSTPILRQMRLSELDLASRAFFARELRLQNRIPLNLAATMNGMAEPVYLQDGDQIFVPRDDRSVLVFGHVNRPGYIPYRPDRPAEQYVTAAGGRGPFASSSYLVKAGTNQFLPLGEGSVESGDLIFVDREDATDSAELQRLSLEERRLQTEENRSRSDIRIRRAQTVLQFVATVASVVTTYLIITRD